jgi:hypothetical protein
LELSTRKRSKVTRHKSPVSKQQGNKAQARDNYTQPGEISQHRAAAEGGYVSAFGVRDTKGKLPFAKEAGPTAPLSAGFKVYHRQFSCIRAKLSNENYIICWCYQCRKDEL